MPFFSCCLLSSLTKQCCFLESSWMKYTDLNIKEWYIYNIYAGLQGCSSQRELFMAVAMVHDSSVKFKVSAEGFKYLSSLKSFWQRLFKRLSSSIESLWFLQVSFKTPVVLFSSRLWPQHTACYYHFWHAEGRGAKVDAAWCDSCFPGATDTLSKCIESVCMGWLGDMAWT